MCSMMSRGYVGRKGLNTSNKRNNNGFISDQGVWDLKKKYNKEEIIIIIRIFVVVLITIFSTLLSHTTPVYPLLESRPS